jgi:purine-binding chemotaxis protein CheW
MESYLDELFDDESESSPQSPEITESAEIVADPTIEASDTNVEHTEPINTDHITTDQVKASTTDDSPKKDYPLGKTTSQLTTKQRHQIERVERLLDDYNQRSLKKADAELAASEATLSKPQDNLSLLPPVLDPIIEPSAELDKVVSEDEVAHEVEVPEPKASTSTAIKVQPTAVSKISQFKENAFQALIFNVAGMNLAVPLISLGGINRFDQEVTELFGKPGWFMGLTPGHNGNINVVDTCRWVMPERYAEAKAKGLDYTFTILLGETQWGLCCSQVHNAITVEPDQVKWRTENSKRPWLAGMLIPERCVLLDVEVMIELLNSDYQR